MNDEIKFLFDKYIIFDTPIPFKDNFHIHPFTVKDCYDFINSYDILDIDKNQMGDIKIIKMSYLEFLLSWGVSFEEENGINIIDIKLYTLLTKSLKLDQKSSIKYVGNGKKIALEINGIVITDKDFDELRKIILYQNILEYDDTYMDPAMKKAINDYYSLVNRGTVPPTLDKKMSVVQSHTGMNKKELTEMSYRSFELLFNTCVEEVDYTINRISELNSQKIEFKNPVDHWVYKPDKVKYSDAFGSFEGYKNKMKDVT